MSEKHKKTTQKTRDWHKGPTGGTVVVRPGVLRSSQSLCPETTPECTIVSFYLLYRYLLLQPNRHSPTLPDSNLSTQVHPE